MNRIRILALISAILTAVLVFVFLQGLNKPAPVVTAPVVLAAQTIPARTKISSEMLKVVELPPQAVHADAVRSIEDLNGTTTLVQIEADEQVLTSKVLKSAEVKGGLSYRIPDDMRAITIPVDEVTGVAGYLDAQDTVDVLSILEYESVIPQTQERVTRSFSFMLLQDVTVLSAGNKEQNAAGNPANTYGTVTLLVSPGDAVKLNLAVTRGSIRLILRSTNDHEKSDVPPEFNDTLVESNLPQSARDELQATPTPSPTPLVVTPTPEPTTQGGV